MTKGKKLALRAIRLAAGRIRERVLADTWPDHCDEHTAYFHLNCAKDIQYPTNAVHETRTYFEPVWIWPVKP